MGKDSLELSYNSQEKEIEILMMMYLFSVITFSSISSLVNIFPGMNEGPLHVCVCVNGDEKGGGVVVVEVVAALAAAAVASETIPFIFSSF